MNSTEEEQAEFLKTGVLHVEENGNQTEGDTENNNSGGLDDTWECVPRMCVTDKRSSRCFCCGLINSNNFNNWCFPFNLEETLVV